MFNKKKNKIKKTYLITINNNIMKKLFNIRLFFVYFCFFAFLNYYNNKHAEKFFQRFK